MFICSSFKSDSFLSKAYLLFFNPANTFSWSSFSDDDCAFLTNYSKLEKIANALPIPILFESRRKKIQRFLSLPILNIQSIWFPIIENWLTQNLPENQRIYLVIDRTKWQRKNLIMISLIYDKRAIPIYWEFLPRLGNSNFEEQSKIFSRLLGLFKKYQTVVLGDREFCSVKLANWLRGQEVQFCLRLKKNEFILGEDEIWHSLDSLGLKPGVS